MNMKLDKSSAAYGAVVLTVVNLISQFIGFVYRIILSRTIGTEAMGLYSLIMPFYAVIMAFCVSGLTVAVSRLSAEYNSVGNQAAIRRLVRSCTVFFLVLFLPICSAVIFFSDPVAADMLGDVRTQTGIIILMPCILLTGLENIHKNYFYGIKNITPPAISEILEQVIRSSSVLLLLFLLDPEIEEYVVALIVCGMVICEIFSSSFLHILYKRALKKTTHRENTQAAPPYGKLIKKIFAVAAPVAFTSLLGNILSSVNAIMIPQRLSVSGLSHEDALSSFGILYGMSLQILGLPMAFISALALIMVPRLAENRALKNLKAAGVQIEKTLYATGMLVLSSVSVLIPLGPSLASFLFGQKQAGDHFTLLALGTAVGGYQIISGSMLNGLGLQKKTLINFFVGSIISLIGTYFLTAMPDIRIAGYAISSLAGSFVTGSLNIYHLHRFTGMKFTPYRWLIAPALACSAGSLWANYFFNLFTPSVGKGVSGIAAAVTCVFICFVAMRFLGIISSLRGFKNKV